MTTKERLQAIEDRYLGQSAREFFDLGGDFHEYAQEAFSRSIFGADVDPAAPELGIETAGDLENALREAAEL